MGQDIKLSGSEVAAFHEKVAIAIQESYDLTTQRFSCGLVAPPFIPAFYDRAADSVVAEAAKFFQKRDEQLANNCTAYSDLLVLGIREQIADNLKYLVPLLKAKSKVNSGGAKDAVYSVNPELHIVTIGQEPAVRACVFSSRTSPPKKLLHSAESCDATSALNSLLKKTQSMLAIQFGVHSKVQSKVNSSMSTKVGSAVTDFFSSATTKVADSKFSRLAAPTCDAPVTKATTSKVESEKKTKRVRNKSITAGAFWDSSNLNNTSFDESYAEPSSGGDSGFRSANGDPHPNRSYNDLPAVAAVPASIQHARVMAEVAPEATPVAASGGTSSVALEVPPEVASKVASKVASERVSLDSDKFF